MVLDGLKRFQSKKSKSKTFNYKSASRYLVLPLIYVEIRFLSLKMKYNFPLSDLPPDLGIKSPVK